MLYRILADAVVVTHFLFIVFVVLGAVLVLWRRWIAAIHLPAAFWGTLIELQGWICPLTPLENRFRVAAGAGGYEGGFIEHYLVPVIYPAGLTRDHQYVLALMVVVVNVAVYAWVLRRGRAEGAEERRVS